MDEIEQYTKQQPLTSELKPLSKYFSSSTITTDHNNDKNHQNHFQLGIEYLKNVKHYTHYRSVRGDGNCFYRALLYNLIETIIQIQQQQQKEKEKKYVKKKVVQEQQEQSDNPVVSSTQPSPPTPQAQEIAETAQTTTTTADELVVEYLRTGSYHDILNIGKYNELTMEIFYDTFVDVIDRYCTTSTTTTGSTRSTNDNSNDEHDHDHTNENVLLKNFHTEMNLENNTSDYCTWYLRVLTATYIKKDPERFVPYILAMNQNQQSQQQQSASTTTDSSVDSEKNEQQQQQQQHNEVDYYISIVQQYCLQEIEPMNKECEEIQVIALIEAFNHIELIIEYLDGHDPNGIVQHHTFNNNNNNNLQQEQKKDDLCPIQLTLLYRPGHYDILYKL